MSTYPETRRSDTVDVLHGIEVPDPYRWLEDVDSDETGAWIKAQNAVTFEHLGRIPARAAIRDRLAALWTYDQYGVPVKRQERVFYQCRSGMQNQSVLYWQPEPDAETQVLLDPNGLSPDGTVALTGWSVSDDGGWLAYGLSSAGSDWQEWRVRRVDTGEDTADWLRWVKFSTASWTPDGKGFYYCRYDAPEEGAEYKGVNCYHKLYYHRLGTDQDQDRLVYHRPDQRDWFLSAEVSEDGRYLVIHVSQGTQVQNAVHLVDLTDPEGTVVELLGAFDAEYRWIGNDGTLLYFLTDCNAPLGRVIGIDARCPERAHWRQVVAESAHALVDAHIVGGRIVAAYLTHAQTAVKVYDKAGGFEREVELPGMGSATGFGGRQDDPETYYLYTSFAVPGTVYRYDVSTGESTRFRAPELAFDSAAFVTRQVFCPSKDGTRVPVFLTHHLDLEIGPDTPTYLYGYGGFNISLAPTFSVANLMWMEMGGVYAQANLRGGGEYGRAWHEAGMKRNKQNVFDDFVSAAEWLIAQGYTSRARLAIGGGSNGGLLVGACLTQRPDLYGACLAAVGVLDMLRFHRFTIGWAWVSDYGSPDDPEDFAALIAYSPYHNVHPGTSYPATLITTADHDDRVYPAHSFKFAAALQAAQAGDAPLLIRIETRAGHGMGKPTSKLIEEAADRWAFVVGALDLEPWGQ